MLFGDVGLGQTSSPPITTARPDDGFGTAENTGDAIGASVTGPGGDATTGGSQGGGRGSGRGGGGSIEPACGGPDQPLCEADPAVSRCWVEDPSGRPLFAGGPVGRLAPCSQRGAVGAPRTPAQFAREVAERTPLPLPGVQTSPPSDQDQLVWLPTWMWVQNWSPQTATASEGALTVTVTATPRSVTWDMGEGSEVVCVAGTPWNPDLREEEQSSDCTHRYARSSAHQPDLLYSASATMTWDVGWVATNGESGALGSASRTTEFTMRVAEGQAIVTSWDE